MDYLRSSVNLRAYGQRDPFIEYKREGLMLFKSLQVSIDSQVIKMLPNMGGSSIELKPLSTVEMDAKGIVGNDTVLPSGDKVGRNEKVVIVKDGAELEIKFKKLDSYLKDGWSLKK
jgi:preprotein translocase subunit SecA